MLGVILSAVFTFIWNTVTDGFIYVLVDYFVKSAIQNASEEEKAVIWLGECILLLVISLLIYVTSHLPWLLLIMVALTLGFTQIRGQVNIVYWWYQLLSRWDEFKQHEQSMEEFQKRSKQTQQQPPPGPGPAPLRNIPLSTDPPDYQRHFHVSPRKPIRQDDASYYNRPYQYNNQTSNQTGLLNHVPKSILKPSLPAPPQINLKQTASFTSKIKSVLGIGNNPIPVGMKNSGQNICFMNSVLQCVARSANFTDQLVKSNERKGCSVAESDLVNSTKELLKQIRHPTDFNLTKLNFSNTIDSSKFRLVASTLNPAMFAPPRSGNLSPEQNGGRLVQRQQDAAEMLMWLLDVMHAAMNQADPHRDPNERIDKRLLQRLDRCVSDSGLASQLDSENGNVTLAQIYEMKNKYLRQIEVYSSMDANGHAASVHRLADLDWLLHKIQNCSAWDDTFTGQLVQIQHCLACSRLSPSIQTFTVLPVPIVDPREVSGVVYLEDCFSKFVTTENLFGRDGLCCPCSNPMKKAVQKTPQPARSRLISADSAIHSPSTTVHSGFMSPIPNVGTTSLNDSGFPEHFRTSTPIADKPILTNGQRRALLRQLPKCLVIQLMRFRFSNQYHDQYKVHTPVHIPLTNLSLKSVLFDGLQETETNSEGTYSYDLYGMCLHLGAGNTGFGHYVAYCQSEDGAWWKLDDEDVTQVNFDFELNTRLVRENAYLLFYKRTEAV